MLLVENRYKFYFSDEYKAAKAIRDKGVDTDLMIVEGL